jgi:hypothetical protein
MSRDAGCNTPLRFNGDGEGRAEQGGIVLGYGGQAQRLCLLFRQGKAYQAPAVVGHEIDGLGGHVVGSESQVPFVLPILVVDQDHHPRGPDLLLGGLDRRQRHCLTLPRIHCYV